MSALSSWWCVLHDCHLNDPEHAYSYPECERNLREATLKEDLIAWWRRLTRRGRSDA